MDARQDLYENLVMLLVGNGIDTEKIKDGIYVTLSDYEINMKCTEVAVRHDERNHMLIKKFLTAKIVKGCTERTIEYYRNTLLSTLLAINKTVDDITADDIRLYVALRMRREQISEVTADNELRILRSFFTYLTTEEVLTKNPMVKVDRIKCAKTKKEAFTDDEVERLRMVAGDEREKAMVELLLSTGCRVSELANIKLKEIEGDKVLLHGKGRKDRYAYLNAKARVSLDIYLKARKDTCEYLFPGGLPMVGQGKNRSNAKDWWKDPNNLLDKPIDIGTIEQRMRKLAKKAGVEKANPHKFRRTCATMALRRGMPIEQVSKMLGHESLETTQIYLDLSEEDFRQAHKKYVL